MVNSEIPKGLIDQIKDGNVVLFLGAGASFDTEHPKKMKAPLGNELANAIAKEYLGEEYLDNNLQYISELAISERNLFTVQKFIYDLFKDFRPGFPHLRIPLYKWHSIYTTNYDLVIEKAYQDVDKKQQELVVFTKNSERVQDKMNINNPVMYNKLHGSISEIYDENLPLILTPDQYIDHRNNRSRLFDRLEEACREFPILFVGVSFADQDIRQTLKLLESTRDIRPRSYMIGPKITPIEERLWEGKKISSIKLTFKQFMESLDSKISYNERLLSTLSQGNMPHPIMKKFVVTLDGLPSTLSDFLIKDALFIHQNLPTKDIKPQDFYKGYFESWDPIIKDLDVTREITDQIISEVFLIEDSDRLSLQDFYIIRGNAGSGKSVLLHRIAWNAGVLFDKLCLFYQSDIAIEYNRLAELFNYTKERIYLFLDNIVEKTDDIDYILKKAQKDGILLTVIACERTNVWNTLSQTLGSFLTRDYELQYLNDKEIEDLIAKLTIHKSLGYLDGKSFETQKEELAEKANRELLVALHEATSGKPFEDIIIDEYNSIPDEEAKEIYTSICVFHRIGTYARAGIISRLHNINFTYFKEKLFKPLESIVYHKRNYLINDYIYTTRHQYIAELVFEHVYTDQEARFQKYISILAKLDFGYESDRLLFIALTKAKLLIDTFKDPTYIRNIYDVAYENLGDDAALLQQEAIFEMTIDGGNMEEADTLLNLATEIDPKNTNILHSRAEFLLKKAERARQKLAKQTLLRSAKSLADKIIKDKSKNTVRGYHTLLKINLAELSDLLLENDTNQINNKIQDFEKILNKGIQLYPNDSFLLESESSFNELINKIPEAHAALKAAFESDKRSPYLAIRLSNYYLNDGRIKDAMSILNECLSLNINNKDLYFRYTKLLMEDSPENYEEIRHYLRKSFTKNDKRYEAHFWYARLLYILGDKENLDYFDHIKNAPLDFRLKKRPVGVITENGVEKIFQGTIIKLENSYGFIKEDLTSEGIYFVRDSVHDSLRFGNRVKFKKAFNYNGAIGILL